MKKRQIKKEENKTAINNRYDSLIGQSTGRGTSKDKMEQLVPNVKSYSPTMIRQWYRSNGFLQNIIDAPAEDAVKDWITITTNRDHDGDDPELPGLGISRLIVNRMDELGIREKISDLIRFSRMYEEGGFMYIGVIADDPQSYEKLSFPMPAIDKIDYINVFGPDYVSVIDHFAIPLSANYHTRKYYISGIEVHESRLFHLVRKYIQEDRKGISVVSTIIDSILAQDTALWSIAELVYEMAVWVFKSPDFKNMKGDELAKTLAYAKSVMSTQGFMGIADDEELQRIVGTEASKGFLKEAADFIFENLAGMATMPKSRLMGQSQGVITAGQFDLRGYYESISRMQEKDIRPVLHRIIELIINERKGAIYAALSEDTSSLDWEIKFNPLWVQDPAEESDQKLKNAQTDQIYITSGVLQPSEVKELRFSELEEFDEWEDQPLDFTPPIFEQKDKEKDKKDEEKTKNPDSQ
jgi:phage-related protein (TIGR01555 family)